MDAGAGLADDDWPVERVGGLPWLTRLDSSSILMLPLCLSWSVILVTPPGLCQERRSALALQCSLAASMQPVLVALRYLQTLQTPGEVTLCAPGTKTTFQWGRAALCQSQSRKDTPSRWKMVKDPPAGLLEDCPIG